MPERPRITLEVRHGGGFGNNVVFVTTEHHTEPREFTYAGFSAGYAAHLALEAVGHRQVQDEFRAELKARLTEVAASDPDPVVARLRKVAADIEHDARTVGEPIQVEPALLRKAADALEAAGA